MVLDRRAGQAQAVPRVEPAGEPASPCVAAFLIACASSSTARCHCDRQQPLGVARQQRVGRQHQVAVADLGEAAARGRRRAATGPAAPARSAPPRPASSARRWSGRRRGRGGRAGPRASRPGYARASAPSCRGPYRRRGCRRARIRAGTAASPGPAAGSRAASARSPAGGAIACTPEKPRSRSARARSRSPPSQRSRVAASISASATASPIEMPSVPSGDRFSGWNSSTSVARIALVRSSGSATWRPSASWPNTTPPTASASIPPSRSRTRRSSEVSTGSSGTRSPSISMPRSSENHQPPPSPSEAFQSPSPSTTRGRKSGVDLDAPAVPLQRRHGIVDKIGPRRRVVIKAEGEQLALALHLREIGRRQQPGCRQPPLKGGLRRIMAPPHDDASVLDMAQFGGRGGRVDDLAVILVSRGRRSRCGRRLGRRRSSSGRRACGSPGAAPAPADRWRISSTTSIRGAGRPRPGNRRASASASAAAWFGATGGAAQETGGDLRRHAEIERSGEVLPGSTYHGAAQGRISPSPSASRASTA